MLNERTRDALRAQHLPEDGLSFVVSEGGQKVADEVRDMRFYFQYLLKPWGVSREAAARVVAPLSLLGYRCESHLRPPKRVELVPRYGTGWFRAEVTPRFEEVMWRHDSFDVAVTPPASAKEYPLAPNPSRSAYWEMAGDEAPMTVAEAVDVFRTLKTSDPGEELLRISVLQQRDDGTPIDAYNVVRIGSSTAIRRLATRIWSYELVAVRPAVAEDAPVEPGDSGRLFCRDGRHFECSLQSDSLNDKCRWPNLAVDPPLSPARALERLREHLRRVHSFAVQPLTEGAILHRALKTDHWFYEVRLEFPPDAAIASVVGLVLLDGRVIPFGAGTKEP
jgi:hypothetical protein